jgi:hypothetical protein
VQRNEIRRRVDAGYVSEVRHPTLPLTLYNYTPRCQFDRAWDAVTKQCRGIVFDDQWNVVARPFPKFFNDTEHQPHELPWHLGCEVTEKMDGSLGILFHFGGGWHWATRGSFTSHQAGQATAIHGERYGSVSFDPAVTYLFEIIYPANRVVVDYGDRRDLVLLSMIETTTGHERPLSTAPTDLRVVRSLPPTADVASLRALIRDDQEGYVLRFADGFRVKVKGARYMEIHRMVSGISSKLIWETLSQGKSFDELLELVPDECADWVRAERAEQSAGFDALLERARLGHAAVKGLSNRKEQALFVLRDFREVSAAVFALLDGRSIDSILWQQLYPEFRRPGVVGRMNL